MAGKRGPPAKRKLEPESGDLTVTQPRKRQLTADASSSPNAAPESLRSPESVVYFASTYDLPFDNHASSVPNTPYNTPNPGSASPNRPVPAITSKKLESVNTALQKRQKRGRRLPMTEDQDTCDLKDSEFQEPTLQEPALRGMIKSSITHSQSPSQEYVEDEEGSEYQPSSPVPIQNTASNKRARSTPKATRKTTPKSAPTTQKRPYNRRVPKATPSNVALTAKGRAMHDQGRKGHALMARSVRERHGAINGRLIDDVSGFSASKRAYTLVEDLEAVGIKADNDGMYTNGQFFQIRALYPDVNYALTKEGQLVDANGRAVGRKLVPWHRPRMFEKLLLSLVYELHRRGMPIPWDAAMHRVHPGSSGSSAQQALHKLRDWMIVEGHEVPPVLGKVADYGNFEIRGFIRDMESENPHVVRAVGWAENTDHLCSSLPIEGFIRGSGNYRRSSKGEVNDTGRFSRLHADNEVEGSENEQGTENIAEEDNPLDWTLRRGKPSVNPPQFDEKEWNSEHEHLTIYGQDPDNANPTLGWDAEIGNEGFETSQIHNSTGAVTLPKAPRAFDSPIANAPSSVVSHKRWTLGSVATTTQHGIFNPAQTSVNTGLHLQAGRAHHSAYRRDKYDNTTGFGFSDIYGTPKPTNETTHIGNKPDNTTGFGEARQIPKAPAEIHRSHTGFDNTSGFGLAYNIPGAASTITPTVPSQVVDMHQGSVSAVPIKNVPGCNIFGTASVNNKIGFGFLGNPFSSIDKALSSASMFDEDSKSYPKFSPGSINNHAQYKAPVTATSSIDRAPSITRYNKTSGMNSSTNDQSSKMHYTGAFSYKIPQRSQVCNDIWPGYDSPFSPPANAGESMLPTFAINGEPKTPVELSGNAKGKEDEDMNLFMHWDEDYYIPGLYDADD